ncbi:hypothetical protein [Rhizobium metallidurans]|uniref:Uncharacterized protein n=1 Tax=Rhizobium metallidurans TaxID=1265931 RepID=A0A7W6D268_9HYPH|nr:hypothetical protein [Rhizobium metallidurans]MBB3966756.1 hypothetical protein [Rhizobium metallidurans]
MSKFDPVRDREVAAEFLLKFVHDTEWEPGRPMGNVAASQIGRIVNMWLVRHDKEMEPALHHANRWLDQVLEVGGEKFGPDPNAHLTTLHWARAMGTWLEDGLGDEGNWYGARIREEARWRFPGRPWPRHEIIQHGLDDYLAFTYQSGEHADGFEAGIDMYEHWLGDKPLSLKKVLKPREYGYALCLHYARGTFDDAELFEAGRRMLQANLEATWLGGGQYTRAATWLKIVYEQQPAQLSPLDVVLKAYDNMPNVPRPDFL